MSISESNVANQSVVKQKYDKFFCAYWHIQRKSNMLESDLVFWFRYGSTMQYAG